MKLGYVFPGQGAQYVGMGQELARQYPFVRKMFADADRILGYALSELCWSGPEDTLRLTYHTQPAILTHSIAALRVFTAALRDAAVTPIVAAGHSLGEYSALVASGALSFEDAVLLVHRRGRFMDEAVPAGQGAMAAVLGMEGDTLANVCAAVSTDGEIVELANLNCPGQVVISGTAEGVARASVLAREHGAKRVIPLDVSGPFHCQLMKPAAEQLAAALGAVDIKPASMPIVTNVDAVPQTEPTVLRGALVQQLYSSVRFEADVREMLRLGVQAFIEFGPGTVLSGMIKKIERGTPVFHVEDEASLRETLHGLGLD